MADFYRTKSRKIAGTSYSEVYKRAFQAYRMIKRRTKRIPYIRSAYFKRDKVFLSLFWRHLQEKDNLRDKTRRLKYFISALELISKSVLEPSTKENPNKRTELLYRFYGRTSDNAYFVVQIKEHKRTSKKFLISVFPINQKDSPPSCGV